MAQFSHLQRGQSALLGPPLCSRRASDRESTPVKIWSQFVKDLKSFDQLRCLTLLRLAIFSPMAEFSHLQRGQSALLGPPLCSRRASDLESTLVKIWSQSVKD